MNSGFFLVMDFEVSTSEKMDIDQPKYDNRTWARKPRKPNHNFLWQLAQNGQWLLISLFFLPLLPNQDQSKKANYVLQTNNILCPASMADTPPSASLGIIISIQNVSLSFSFSL